MTASTCIYQGLLPTKISTILCWSVGGEKTRKGRRSGKYIYFYSAKIWDTRLRSGVRLVSYRGINNFRNMYIDHRVILLYIVLEKLFSYKIFLHFDYIILSNIFYILFTLSFIAIKALAQSAGIPTVIAQFS